jgi:hypothetical protein
MENDTPIYSLIPPSELSGLSAETAARISENPMPTSQRVSNLTPLELVGQGQLSAKDAGKSDPVSQPMPSTGKEPSGKGRG